MTEQNDYSSSEKYIIVSPEASALTESLRAFGYTPQTAIADLLDNSITAGAKNIWIDYIWNGSDSYITIRDDGKGMTRDELVSAMRAGSRNPRHYRDQKDLGRFGLGLKTASFSQCRALTVSSRTSGLQKTTWRWDLDYIGQVSEWRLLQGAAPGSEQRLRELEHQESGTLVLWECLDRIAGSADVNDQKAHKRFLKIIESTESHLGMIFQRFIDDPHGITIYVNKQQIRSWEPFLYNEPTTQHFPEERLHLNNGIVKVRPYVLPHHSRLSPEVYERAAGPGGWNARQGFYIYRNRRLLVAGDWLGLGFQKEESSKLARIAIDLPNSLDDAWNIDVRKSRARPPGILHDDLRRIARITREAATRVYRHRSKVLARQTSEKDIFVWNKEIKHGRIAFRINRQQPLAVELLQSSHEYRDKVEALLRLIEETIPVPLIIAENGSHANDPATPFEQDTPAEVLKIVRQVYLSLLQQGFPPTQAADLLAKLEPFQYFKHFITLLSDDETVETDL